MSIHLIKLLCIPIITLCIVIFSLLVNKCPNVLFMIISALLLSLSVTLDRKFPWLKWVQFVLLGVFHYSSQISWVFLIYCLLIADMIDCKANLKVNLHLCILFILEFLVIRFTYTPINATSLFISVFYLLSCMVAMLLFHIMTRMESEKKNLHIQNDYLTNHDPLTGLLNYDGYMKKVQCLIEASEPFLLVLLDINNFKSHNAKDIATANEILINTSQMIQSCFQSPLGMSRYAGDHFAVLLRPTETVVDHLEFDELDIQVTYSITRYPEEVSTFQDLISTAEDRLFQVRRDLWLKRQEELMRSEKMKTVGELAAGMAHEIRNPLTSIKGFIQLSKNQNYNIQPWYEVIMGEITRVGELTAEFLQFSKPHVSNMKKDSLSDCILRVYSLCESEAVSQGHMLTFELPESPILVRMDRDKIIQVLINLIRNALQAMDQSGQVHIALSQEGGMAVIAVKDSGKGIAPQQIKQIFDPFYTTKEEGTGLGLSLCHKIVEDHNGSIEVESEVGVGTTFIVKLPAID